MNPGAGVAAFGREARLLGAVLGRATRALPRMRPSDYVEQLGRVALSALPLVGIAALFAGMVIALQTSLQLARLGMEHMVADIVSVSLVRELAPIFTALLMAGKAGAGLASELGMVTLSGQAQAMRAMSLDIDRELVAPRVWACITGTVLLTIAAILLGLIGGMILGAAKLGISPVHYLNRAVDALAPVDFACGLLKAAGFGVIIASLGVSFGLKDKADAGVLGRHTMSAVVVASFLVLVSDHVFTTLIVATLG
ncbi:MAG: transporter [Deltaproteobacteria bacterium HGW-Deltaproteobacteria-14]|jgi:phospholipid/cholesterol/gamma-HCH transport system permease protein|nr:MAG: transporter [Deltaproteobacteria bacterium HGW-Deltaproteobacteria-14]